MDTFYVELSRLWHSLSSPGSRLLTACVATKADARILSKFLTKWQPTIAREIFRTNCSFHAG